MSAKIKRKSVCHGHPIGRDELFLLLLFLSGFSAKRSKRLLTVDYARDPLAGSDSPRADVDWLKGKVRDESTTLNCRV